jgi:hypothetical protein
MKSISTAFDADRSGKPVRALSGGAWFLVLASVLQAGWFSPVSWAQSLPAGPPPQLDPPTLASCGPSLTLYDSPFFKICYPKRWHIIRGYGVDYAWWVFSKRKRGERFDIPYIRVIIAKGIAEPHLDKQNDSTVLGQRTYIKTTNEFREVNGRKPNGRYWREIAVGPEFDILAWYEQIKMKHLKQFDQALDSFWVPPPPRVRPKPEK